MRYHPTVGKLSYLTAGFSVQMSTRKAYGMALAKLGRYNERVVAMDSDTNNFTYSEIFKNEHPNRFVECYLAQQNMVRPHTPNTH